MIDLKNFKSIKKDLKRYTSKNSPIYILLIFIILIYIFITQDNPLSINYEYQEEVDGVNTSIEETKDSLTTILNNPSNTTYTVTSVVDGDTIKVEGVGTLRLIGIDTPETVDPRKEVECFGIEASNKAKELLEGKQVKLEFDSSQGTTDRYGRVLAYVYIEGDLFFNLEMIKQGYAYEYTYSTPYKYQEVFKEAQYNAQQAQLGLWGEACN